MSRWNIAVVLVVLAVVTMGCARSGDECERALARLERIEKSQGRPVASKATTQRMLESCRTGKYASHDPVLRCAMDSATDDSAADCIGRSLKDVVKPSADSRAGGSGLNPLLPNH